MSALGNFIKTNAAKNAGDIPGQIGIGASLVQLVAGTDKLKALKDLLINTIAATALWDLTMSRALKGMQKGLQSVLHDTGSLDQALRKLSQIQGLEKVFSPLVGGAEAAKQKVAELVNFAASRNLKLDSVAEAARSLTIMTRGAYDSAKALDVINDSAAATGNNLVDTADAVGGFYTALRDGQPIDSAAESLRDMGIISQSTADKLENLQKNGAGAGQIFDALTASMQSSKGGAAAIAGNIDQVNQAFDLAKKNLQEKFASPFTEAEVNNTKNWTAAMNAVAPSVERIAQFLQILTGGFSTLKSATVEWLAQSALFRGSIEAAIVVVGVLAAGLSLLGTIGIVEFLAGATLAMGDLVAKIITATGATGLLAGSIETLGVVIQAALGVSIIGLIVTVLGSLVAMQYNASQASERQRQALVDLKNAHDQTTAAIIAQSAAVKTLADHHEALAAALTAVGAAQKEVEDAWKTGGAAQQDEAQRNLDAKQAAADAEENRDTSLLAQTGEQQEAIRKGVERGKMLHEQEFQSQMRLASPETQAELLGQRSEEYASRAERARAGVQARADYSVDSANADTVVDAAQKELDKTRAHEQAFLKTIHATDASDFENAKLRIEAAKDKLDAAKQQQQSVGLNAAQDSSVYAEAMVRQLQGSGGSQKDISNWQIYAEQRRQEEQNATQLEQTGKQAESDQVSLKRENDLANTRAIAERNIAQLKERGADRAQKEAAIRLDLLHKEYAFELNRPGGSDPARLTEIAAQAIEISRQAAEGRYEATAGRLGLSSEIRGQEAQLHGDVKGVNTEKDLAIFAENLAKARGIATGSSPAQQEANAEAIARRMTENQVRLNFQQQLQSDQARVSSTWLARVGGGGNIAAGGDKLINLTQRIADDAKKQTEYLSKLANARGTPLK